MPRPVSSDRAEARPFPQFAERLASTAKRVKLAVDYSQVRFHSVHALLHHGGILCDKHPAEARPVGAYQTPYLP